MQQQMISGRSLSRMGFRRRSWTDEGVRYTDYRLSTGKVDIEVTPQAGLVEIGQNGYFTTIPNCRTIGDLSNLIKLVS